MRRQSFCYHFKNVIFFQIFVLASVSNKLRSMYTWMLPTMHINMIWNADHAPTLKLFSSAKFRSRASFERRRSNWRCILFKLSCNFVTDSWISETYCGNGRRKKPPHELQWRMKVFNCLCIYWPVLQAIYPALHFPECLCPIRPLFHPPHSDRRPIRWSTRKRRFSYWTNWMNCRSKSDNRLQRLHQNDGYYRISCTLWWLGDRLDFAIQMIYRDLRGHHQWLKESNKIK